MPRAGLTPAALVAAGADLADEVGFADLTLARLAERVGVRAPSLYKHVASQADLTRRIAVLALDEAAEAIGAATQGRSGRDALAAAVHAFRRFVLTHPGRYAATLSLQRTSSDAGPDAPLGAPPDEVVAAGRALDAFAAVLRGYEIAPQQMPHALRALRSTFHGFATLESAGGFQFAADIDESFEWLIDLMDRGLRAMASAGAAAVPAD